jgi:hypothetical protein
MGARKHNPEWEQWPIVKRERGRASAEYLAGRLHQAGIESAVIDSPGGFGYNDSVVIRVQWKDQEAAKKVLREATRLKENPAVSAEQYGLAQAVLSGAVRGPSMPKEVAREIIDRTPEAERVKFAKELAEKRNNPGVIGVEPGRIGVYYTNHDYFADATFDNLEQAIEFARRSGFEASFWRDTQYLGSWSILGGYERPVYGATMVANPSMEFDNENDAKKYKRLVEAEGEKAYITRAWSPKGGWVVSTTIVGKKNRRNPTSAELYQEWMAADDAFSQALEKQYGRRAGDIRYDRSKQTPEIQELGDRFRALGEQFRESGGMLAVRGSMVPNQGKRYGLHLKKGRKSRGNPVVATLTQGTVQGEVLELGPNDYQVIISGMQGQVDEDQFDNFDAAMQWARLRIFETAENPDYIDSALSLAAPAALGPAGALITADQTFAGKSSITSKAISKGRKALAKLFPRANPSGTSADLYEEFHGTPSTETLEYIQREHFHEWLAALGQLIELVIENEQGTRSLTLKGPDPQDSKPEDVVMVAFNERKKGEGPLKGADQCYFVGGDQSIDIDMLMDKFGMVEADVKENMLIGRIRKLTYRTKKTFEQEGKQEIDFFHEHGKEGARGVLPMLVYKPLNPSMEVVGGRYSIAPGTATLGGVSPGIVG